MIYLFFFNSQRGKAILVYSRETKIKQLQEHQQSDQH